MRFGYFLLVLCVIMAASCSRQNTTAPYKPSSEFPNGLNAKESPMLAELVRKGELPPFESRLPAEPLVVKPFERPGVYGGMLYMIHDSPDLAILKIAIGYAPLLRWRSDSNGVEPGLAKSYEYRDGGRTLIIKLRKGLKWSDGYPYTSADFKFYYDLCLDSRYKLRPPGWCIVNGRPMTVETPDPLTIVMHFAGPNYFAHLQLATGFWNPEEYNIPKHYMIKFHPDYNHRYKDFTEFDRKNLTHLNPNRPTMCPWRLVSIESAGSKVVFERNPYYYMTDTLGRQLPYIDRIESTLIRDSQLRVLRMLAGEVDVEFRLISLTDLTDLGLYMKGRSRGGYRIKLWEEGGGAMSAVVPNWDQKDPVLRRIIRDKRFRRALSYAVPREKINLVVYRGMAVPQNSVISAQSWHFRSPEGKRLYEQWRRAFSEYDIARANALLDEMGLKRGADGYRMRPDGRRLTLVFMVGSASYSRRENDEAVMIANEWEKLGIKVIISTPPGPEIANRIRQGDYDITMIGESEMDLFTYPAWVFPVTNEYWHPLTGKWYETGGKQGTPPDGPAEELVDIFMRIKSEPDLEKCHKLVLDAIRLHLREGPFTIGTVGGSPAPVLVKNYLHNVPNTGVLGPWAVSQPAASYPEQFYLENGGRQR